VKKLYQLAKALKDNDFQMTEAMKEQFEEYLSIIAEGSRVLHPLFGIGTVTGTLGNNWVNVEFDKHIEKYEVDLRNYELNKIKEPNGWRYKPSKPSKRVMISSCTSIHMLIKRELNR
jgi:hypothetical protein